MRELPDMAPSRRSAGRQRCRGRRRRGCWNTRRAAARSRCCSRSRRAPRERGAVSRAAPAACGRANACVSRRPRGRVGRRSATVRTGSIRLEADGDLASALQRHGEVPLPPYIRRPHGPLPEDRDRYQTVFARVPGAIAAPTAGLHFTPRCSRRSPSRGIDVAAVTLLVGPATFLPVRSDARRAWRRRRALRDSAARGRRDRAPRAPRGAASSPSARPTVRALESAAAADGAVHAGPGRTALVIASGAPLSRRRRAAHELPSAALELARAGRGVRRDRADARRLPRGDATAAIASTATATRC